jgi:SAM-dependent methyltransferase
MQNPSKNMEINWLSLWRELTIANPRTINDDPLQRYKRHAYQKQERPDPLLDFVLQSVDKSLTVLDIGAGSGRWTIPISKIAGSVTAIEPAVDMLNLLWENTKDAETKISTVQSTWEDAEIDVHDIIVCAHSMYSSPDLALFVRKMEQHARKICYMSIRLPPIDGIIGELAKVIYGRPYDSANAIIAYNALYSIGIYANILVENEIYPWTNNSFEEAYLRAKRHLNIESASAYDELIRDTLSKRLSRSGDLYIWPDGMRSALLWWNPYTASK